MVARALEERVHALKLCLNALAGKKKSHVLDFIIPPQSKGTTNPLLKFTVLWILNVKNLAVILMLMYILTMELLILEHFQIHVGQQNFTNLVALL